MAVKLKKSPKKLTNSSRSWLLRHLNDPYVAKAQKEGYRSRAAFKIIEIDDKFKLFKKGKIVVDLGAAPGGWSQIAAQKVGAGNVLATDILPIESIAGVEFLQLDFLEEGATDKIKATLANITQNKNSHCDIVLSDMAANTTGDKSLDHLRIINLLELALFLSKDILKPGGAFVGKIFQGGSSNDILSTLRQSFSSVKYFKPDSSRKDSAETYLVATGFRSNYTKLSIY